MGKKANHPIYKKLIRFGFLFLTMSVSFSSFAQTLEVGAFGGASYYLGDLNTQKHFIESQPAFGAVLKYNLNQRWAIGLAASQGRLTSDATDFNSTHPNNQVANLSTNLTELALLSELNFFPYAIGDRKNFWTPYVFAGLSAFSSSNTSLAMAAPFGLGFKFSPIRKIGLSLFWSARKTFTDNLDKVVSIDYQGYNGDWYFFYGLNITFAFRLQKDVSCRNLINRKYN